MMTLFLYVWPKLINKIIQIMRDDDNSNSNSILYVLKGRVIIQQQVAIMLKDHFQRSTASLNNLRSEHFKVSEYLNKGRYRLKQKFFGKGKKHYDFDINSQEFFHEHIDDIVFDPTEVQQIFYNQINKSLQSPIVFNNKRNVKDTGIEVRKNPSEVRVNLARHFHNRAFDLGYKKYQTLLRAHNYSQEEHMTAIRSRVNLLEKEIQQCQSRETRLWAEDYFESSYTQGGKPVPVNENGQPIYKYLDEEDCWFSNINREDVQAYLRNSRFRDELLEQVYWPYWYQFEYLVLTEGIRLSMLTEDQIADDKQKLGARAIQEAKGLINLLQKGLQDLSPGNLQQKQNLTNFVYFVTGINNESAMDVPLYPAITMELLHKYNKILPSFFKHLAVGSQKDIIDLLPKLNSFCSILFKYQNQQILEGEKQMRLGLDDEVDIKKQLVTMLEEQWVTKHIRINFARFQYKMYLKPVDWQLDAYSQRLEKEIRFRNQNQYAHDLSMEELVRMVRLTSYVNFRKIMKKRAEKILERLPSKYEDMQLCQRYAHVSDLQMNKQKLREFHKAKYEELTPSTKPDLLKESTHKFLTSILKQELIGNPVEMEIVQTLNCIKLREIRTRMLNILNGLRCYHRNISMDLRVIDGCEFEFQLDDELLINSNKQVLEKYERAVKDNETTISKAHQHSNGVPTIDLQEFLLHGKVKNSMLYKKDRVERQFYNEAVPHILVVDGHKKKNILYAIALEDIKLVETRIMETGSHFISKYERILKMKLLPQLADRMAILSEMFQLQELYLYEKFNLVQNYYYLYENTTEPLNAHKLGKIIVEILYEQPKIDLGADYFRNSYNALIETLREESKMVKQWTSMVEEQERQRVKVFHHKLAQMCKIPLTLWAYVYGDMEVKGAKNYNKLQRMNSVSSKMSRNSKSSKEKNIISESKEQIREEWGEDSEAGMEQLDEEEQFDLEQYDEYVLRRNMDDIFEEIVAADAPKEQKEKDGPGVSSLGLENVTVNPKFEGGPHMLHNYLPDIKVTSHHSQKLINFSETACWVSNLHGLIRRLSKEARDRYGFCSQEYQLRLTKQICLRMNKILLQPSPKLQNFFQFLTDDFYQQTVTVDSKIFQEVMHPILDLPSMLQLSMQATHQRHQNTLPNNQILERFDLSILTNLIRMEKPLNSAVYRELNLSINLIEFTRIKSRMFHLQHQRQQLLKAYKNLGAQCDIAIDKYTHCYGRSGLSEVFLASSEAKVYTNSFLRRPCYNESIDELRTFYEMEEAELQLFRQTVEVAKHQIEDYVRLAADMERNNKNRLVDRNAVLLSLDKKNVKMVVNRVKGHAGSVAGEVLKTKCYLKYKLKLRTSLEQRIKQVNETNIEELVLKHYLNNDTKKYNRNCQLILAEKVRRNMIREYAKKYTRDLKNNMVNNLNFNQLLECIEKIRNYVQSLPYLSRIFVMPTELQALNKKVFYDQKKLKVVEQEHKEGQQTIYYIESKEQLIEQWQAVSTKCTTSFMDCSINAEQFIKSALPPSNKDELFKWMFRIPANRVTEKEKQSTKHLLRVFEPYTGRISVSQFRPSTLERGSRNKYADLYDRYSVILQYIESNLMLICLQVDGDIVESIFSILDHRLKFEDEYPLQDQAAVYETDPSQEQPSREAQYLNDSPMHSMFVYESRKQQFEGELKEKMERREYRPEKRHLAVEDEILDFVSAKVEGYGVIRHCMLELKDELTLFGKVKSQTAVQYMRSKTRNILSIMWLGLWRTFNTRNDPTTSTYVPIMLDNLLPVPHQEHFQLSASKNWRRGISEGIKGGEVQEQEKIKFEKGIFSLKDSLLTNRLKVIYNFLPFNLVDLMEESVRKSEQLQKDQQKDRANSADYGTICLVRHNQQFVWNLRGLVNKVGKQFRSSLFARMRQFFELGKVYLQTKWTSQKLEAVQLLQQEQKKTAYYEYLMQGKIYMTALTSLKLGDSYSSLCFPESQHKMWEKFNQILQVNKETIDLGTFNIYDQLDAYKDSGKIIMSKTEQAIMANQSQLPAIRQENNKIIRTVIFNKLTAEEFKTEVLEMAIRMLREEKLPKAEGKKIQNISNIPRVHLISSFSSPLIVDRKTYISQQYKLAFVQAFINRFRNKVSRVDLLSSGYGFVITVPDLEDCVNYMNKLLFNFTQKQFRVRLETFSQYYEILIEGIRSRNQVIRQQGCVIKHLQDKVKNTLEAEYLSKVSKLLQEKILIEEKLRLAEQTSNGLEHRVRKAVKHEYDRKMTDLQNQNQQLRANFQNFKDLLIKLTKDSTKNNFLSLLNTLKEQVSSTLSKKIDLSESFKAIEQTSTQKEAKSVVVKEQTKQDDKEKEKQEIKAEYGQEDIQRCKIGQDIIHDPYYVTKLINKMRVFNVFKLGAKKIKHETAEEKKTNEITSLHKIQDRVIAQTEREVVLRKQLTKAQEELSKKSVELEKIKHTIQSLENQKAKLNILLVTKQKKIEQKERENQEIKKKAEDKEEEGKKSSKQSIDLGKSMQEELPKISGARQQKKSRKMHKQPFLTNLDDRSGAMSLYQKFQLSNKDSTWRQKCEQLYLENKKLLGELEKAREGQGGLSTPVTREGYSLNLRNKQTAEQSERDTSRTEKRKFTNLSFKYGVMKE